MNPFRVSASAFIVKDNHALLIKFDDENGVHYNLPGGGIDAGESVVAGLMRECLEEACAEVYVKDLLLTWQYIPELEDFKFGKGQKLGLIFKADLKNGCEPKLPANPDPNQVGVEWVPLEKIFEPAKVLNEPPPFPLFPQVHGALKRALEEKRSTEFVERSPMSWEEYFKKFTGRPPRPQLVKALTHINKPGIAVELGSGAGRDALHLLQEGWHVYAVEKESAGLTMLQKDLPQELRSRFIPMAKSFEEINELPQNDFTYASFSLPFCKPESFTQLWSAVERSLKPGGYFTGNFFGPEDEWAKHGDLSIHSEGELRNLFKDYEILHWEEKNEMAPTAAGPLKHWHLFTIIARRKG